MQIETLKSTPENLNQRVLWAGEGHKRDDNTIFRAMHRLALYDYFIAHNSWRSAIVDRALKERTRFTDRTRCSQFTCLKFSLDGKRLIKVCRVPNIDLHMRCACGDVHAAIPAYENDIKTKWYYKYVK